VLKSNGLHHSENLPVKFGFSPQIVPANIVKKLPSQRCFKPLLIPIFNFPHKRPTFAFTDESGYTLGFRRRIAHSGPHAETGAFPPSATARSCATSEITLYAVFVTPDSAALLYTYISRFSVNPHHQAEGENQAKLPSLTLSPTVSHPVFQLLLQTAHVCLHSRKWVHTRLSEKDRTQRLTRRNRGLPDGAAITTLDTYCTFTNIPGPGTRAACFAAFGSWPGVLPKNAESLRSSDALMRVAVPRRRGPAGPRDLFLLLSELWLTHLVFSAFRMCETRGGITTLGVLCVLPKLPAPAC